MTEGQWKRVRAAVEHSPGWAELSRAPLGVPAPG